MPNDQKNEPSIVEKGLRSLRDYADLNISIQRIDIDRGWFTDAYTDKNGNTLHDGLFGFDSISCRNGAQPTNAQVSRALQELGEMEPIVRRPNYYAFEGDNPIANACNIAPRPARTR